MAEEDLVGGVQVGPIGLQFNDDLLVPGYFQLIGGDLFSDDGELLGDLDVLAFFQRQFLSDQDQFSLQPPDCFLKLGCISL